MCATISQLIALTQTKQQGLWIIGAVGAVIILPPVTLVLLSVAPLITQIRLFTVFAFEAVEKAGVFSIFLALLGQLTILTLCLVQITRQLKKLGESNLLTLLASQPRIKPVND